MSENKSVDKSPFEIMNDKLADIRKDLPSKFESWVSFYNDIIEKASGPVSWVEYRDVYPKGQKSYTFTIEEIKAKCFDEIRILYPSVSQYSSFENWSMGYVVGKIELRKWHNIDTQIGNEGEKANESGGVLNPAILNIG